MLPYLDSIAKDRDIDVRVRAVQLLVDVIEGSDSQKVSDVLNIVEKVGFLHLLLSVYALVRRMVSI